MQIESFSAVFGENYPDPVRVVAVGLGEDTLDDVRKDPTNDKWRAASIELCGGTHSLASGDAQRFVITREEAVAKGVRRVEAVTNGKAAEAARVGDELLAACQTLEKQEAPSQDEQKELRARIDAATCSAAAQAEAAGVARERREAARHGGESKGRGGGRRRAPKLWSRSATRPPLLVIQVWWSRCPRASTGRPWASSPRKSTRRTRAWRCSSSRAAAGRWGPSRPCLTGMPMLAPAGAWLNAALEPPGGRGGGKPTFAQGVGEGRRRRGRGGGGAGRSLSKTAHRGRQVGTLPSGLVVVLPLRAPRAPSYLRPSQQEG